MSEYEEFHKKLAENTADSAGTPWAGRSFHDNPFAGDDGTADPALISALQIFKSSPTVEGKIKVITAAVKARLLAPLVAEAGDIGYTAEGKKVDKTQELSIVKVAGPDGRQVLPLFSSVTAMQTWRADARPVPVDGLRAFASAVGDETELIVLDPGSETEFVVRRPAVWALTQGREWLPSWLDPSVLEIVADSAVAEKAVTKVWLSEGDPNANFSGPELVVHVSLLPGLDQHKLTEIISRMHKIWSQSPAFTEAVDSVRVSVHSD